MQASNGWTPPGGTLGAIVEQTMQRVDALRLRRKELERQALEVEPGPPFAMALRGGTVRVIAELKRRSPSKGEINAQLNAPAQAREYEEGGASAISVLTEPHHFGGSIEDLEHVRSEVRIPLLKKDFHIDDVQLLEARAAGASAALLIARALAPEVLKRLISAALELGLEPLVEVRSDDELDRALTAGARVVGVNCRNLETLEMDPSVPTRLIARVPKLVVAIWESGIASRADVERAAVAGADSVLVGSAISGAPSPRDAVRALADVPTQGGRRD